MKLFLVYSTLDTTIKVFSPINLQSSKASMKGHVLGTQPTARKRRGLQLRKPNVEFAYLILNCVISFCLCIFQTHKISAATTYILTKGKKHIQLCYKEIVYFPLSNSQWQLARNLYPWCQPKVVQNALQWRFLVKALKCFIYTLHILHFFFQGKPLPKGVMGRRFYKHFCDFS